MEEGPYSSRFAGEQSANANLSSATFQQLLHGNLQRRPRSGSSLTRSVPASPRLDAASSRKRLSAVNRVPRSVLAASRKLKFPKLEPVDESEMNRNALATIPMDQIQSFKMCSSTASLLPDLTSMEHVPDIGALSNSGSSSSRYPLTALLSQLPAPPPHLPRHFDSPALPPFMATRQRRKKISDLTRKLEKLMPWEKKMDIASMLEEAHKYIGFLKAQVSVLQAMPRESNFSSAVPEGAVGGGAMGLEKMSRQQLLQVMLGSGAVQEKLYSSGCCVFSVEQMVVLKKVAERKAMQEQMMMMMMMGGGGGDTGLHFLG
ncbi:hypothetical protein ACLOJK_020421 [Asimina triloba]